MCEHPAQKPAGCAHPAQKPASIPQRRQNQEHKRESRGTSKKRVKKKVLKLTEKNRKAAKNKADRALLERAESKLRVIHNLADEFVKTRNFKPLYQLCKVLRKNPEQRTDQTPAMRMAAMRLLAKTFYNLMDN